MISEYWNYNSYAIYVNIFMEKYILLISHISSITDAYIYDKMLKDELMACLAGMQDFLFCLTW